MNVLLHDDVRTLTERTMMGPQFPNRPADCDQDEDTPDILPPTPQVQ